MKYFTNFIGFLNEKKKQTKYGCAMVFFDFPEILKLHSKIKEEDLYDEKGYGLEAETHTTLLYGLHLDINPDKIIKKLQKFDYHQLKLINVSLFENEKYDVLKFDVDGEYLHDINKELCKFPHTNDYPDYHPHTTIAYLKPSEGKKYVKKFKDMEFEVIPKKIVYSMPDEKEEDKKTIIEFNI